MRDEMRRVCSCGHCFGVHHGIQLCGLCDCDGFSDTGDLVSSRRFEGERMAHLGRRAIVPPPSPLELDNQSGPGDNWFLYKTDKFEVMVDMSDIRSVEFYSQSGAPCADVVVGGVKLEWGYAEVVREFKDVFKRYKRCAADPEPVKQATRSIRLEADDD